MSWKKLSAWFKGGLIASIILIIIYIVLMAFSARWLCEYNDMGNISCSTAQVWGTALLPFNSISAIGITLVVLIIAFIIGAVIGLIVGRVKKR